jgi:hypothetical protein
MRTQINIKKLNQILKKNFKTGYITIKKLMTKFNIINK